VHLLFVGGVGGETVDEFGDITRRWRQFEVETATWSTVFSSRMARTMPRPMPRAPPVTMALRFLRSMAFMAESLRSTAGAAYGLHPPP